LADKKLIHVALIPDGNRRWAKSKGLVESMGHKSAGKYENLVNLFEEARDFGVKYFSLWVFSSDNWKRSTIEVKILFEIVHSLIKQLVIDNDKNKVQFRWVGRRDRISKSLKEEIENLERISSKFDDFVFQICLDYGGRDEIIRAVNKILDSGKKEINEKDFSSFLDTPEVPNIDLIIRTSGEQRTSGFMPWQSAYSELYFSPVHFPDFDRKAFRVALESFGKRERRFGGD